MQINNFEYGIEDVQEVNLYEKEFYASDEMQEYIRENGEEELEKFLIRE